ncbi:chorismate-binding protein [Comamonas granuli]|uniref:chorismate-binding protein n=1 Tax=Comamonas granuli TaxID=290309 RepID=UPI0005AA7D7B|nr:chorismate-binding protein [Comamonas granuli]
MALDSRIDFADPHDPAGERLRWAFGPPQAVLAAHTLDEVRPVLDAAEAAARAGAWVLGWLGYEAAPAFDAAFAVHASAPGQPLAWFGVHAAPQPWPAAAEPGSAQVHWQGGHDRAAFDAALARIQQAIGAGELYQVNYTAPLRGELQGSAGALFAALQRAQPGGYAAHIAAGAIQVLSVSPELFFDWQAGADGRGPILTRPMKGTAARGATPADDAQQAARLRASPKERAENVMIVDLLRNDLSRIAEPHSVRVPALCQTAPLPTVWQMTSDVAATTRAGTRLQDVFAALFPCGSVTGAPKVQAMRAIAALEGGPRGVYCGALGLLRPQAGGGLRATFNVPIRTVELQGSAVRCGIGSGIVWGAEPDAEWREWAAKRAFVERASEPFDLLETLRLQDGQWRHLPEHLERMRQAAAHFGYPWEDAALHQCLQALAARHAHGAWRVRLRLDARGTPHAEAFALAPTPEPVLLRLAERPLAQAHGEFVRHKTTRRAHYAAFAPQEPGVFDTVLWNEEGELTEGTFGNIALLLDGRWVTPALACGLLPGVGRAVALREGRVQEAVVRLDDLPRVQGWAFINSLRGWLAARLA